MTMLVVVQEPCGQKEEHVNGRQQIYSQYIVCSPNQAVFLM